MKQQKGIFLAVSSLLKTYFILKGREKVNLATTVVNWVVQTSED